jgi:hypothetical protein
MKLKKISEWLSDYDGHCGLHAEAAKVEFEKETGKRWPEHLKGQPVQKLLKQGRKDPKGLHVWNGPKDAHVLGGWQVAASLAAHYAKGYSSPSLGRGSEFRDCLEALRKAGA